LDKVDTDEIDRCVVLPQMTYGKVGWGKYYHNAHRYDVDVSYHGQLSILLRQMVKTSKQNGNLQRKL